MNDYIQEAVKILTQGGIIIFPTDTAFGVGCRLDKTESVDRLFTIRRRPRTQATPVLVSRKEEGRRLFQSPSNIVRHLMDIHWPGALTIVASCRISDIYAPIRGGGSTIGIRMPNHTDLLHVIRRVGIPILGPSANIHGRPTPYRFDDLDPDFVRLADFVMPGSCKLGLVSTVVDCSRTPFAILRQGAVHL